MLSKTIVLCALALVVFTSASAFADVDDARGVQSKVDELTEEMMHKIVALESEYQNKKIPIYRERNQFLTKVKGFWPRVIENHPSHSQWLQGDDREILKYVTDIDVEHLSEDHTRNNEVRIVMRFAANPYFADTELWREVRHGDMDGSGPVSGVSWMTDRKPFQASFFNYFEKRGSENRPELFLDAHKINDISHVLRYEFWANPFTYFDIPTFEEIAAETERQNAMRHEHQLEEHTIEYNNKEDLHHQGSDADAAAAAQRAQDAAADIAQEELEAPSGEKDENA